jgi:hypothetical protein
VEEREGSKVREEEVRGEGEKEGRKNEEGGKRKG